MFSTNGRAKCKRVLVSRIFSKNMTDFLNLQTANTRKIEMIQEEIGSETNFNVNNNNNVDWLKDKADGVLIRTISNIRSFYVAYEI